MVAAQDDTSPDDDSSTTEDGAVTSGTTETGTTGTTGTSETTETTEGTGATAAAPARTRRTVPARVVTALVVLAVVAGVAAVGVVAWTFVTRSWEVGGVEVAGDQREQQAERDELMSIGRQFMLRSGTYGPEGLDEEGRLTEYRELVTELITPSFANTFDTDAGIAEQLVSQSEVSRTAEVFSTGVSDVEDDAASVLVAGAITDSYPQLDQPQEPFPFRVEVQLVRVEGEWLVDDFAGVQRPEEEQPEVDPDLPLPSDEPSTGGGTGDGNGGAQGGGTGGGSGGGSGGQQGGQR